MSESRIYASVKDGKIHLRWLGTEDGNLIAEPFGHKIGEWRRLVVFFMGLVASYRWDGHLVFSSSMNWPRESGWPDDGANEFVASAVKRACVECPRVSKTLRRSRAK